MALRQLKRCVAKHRMKLAGAKWDRHEWRSFIAYKQPIVVKGRNHENRNK